MSALSGKIAVVTGGGSGIGLAISELFAKEGARVVLTGRRHEVVAAAAARIGRGAIGVAGDVSDPAHHDRVAGIVSEKFGGLDIYVANAGINTINNSALVAEAEYDAQFGTNTRGVFFGVQKLAPLMRPGGAIVITGSTASDKVLDGHAVYAGSKAAIGAFARIWALEFRDRGIRVNVLSPGPVETDIVEKLGIAPQDLDAFKRSMARAIVLGRMGQPEEIAQAALFLASDASSFITGINLRVDGGMALI